MNFTGLRTLLLTTLLPIVVIAIGIHIATLAKAGDHSRALREAFILVIAFAVIIIGSTGAYTTIGNWVVSLLS